MTALFHVSKLSFYIIINPREDQQPERLERLFHIIYFFEYTFECDDYTQAIEQPVQLKDGGEGT